jgi:L-serine/L-threonine ammonia-lyase
MEQILGKLILIYVTLYCQRTRLEFMFRLLTTQ